MNCYRGSFMRSALALVLCGLLFISSAAAETEEETVLPYPDALRINVITETWKTDDGREVEVDIPETCNKLANAFLRKSMNGLLKGASYFNAEDYRLDMRSTYRISGSSWAGFLLMGHVVQLGQSVNHSYETEQTLYLCYDVQTYDLSKGKALTLADVFPKESGAWERIAKLTDEALRAYYSDLPHNEDAIEAFCDTEALRDMSFLPCAGKLMLTFPLEKVVHGKPQLVQINLPYPDFREYMTDTALAQTDNSNRPIIALTYDDGPAGYSTRLLHRKLAQYGASATFFCIGENLAKWPDMVRRTMDEGNVIGSHTMKHKYAYQVRVTYLREDRIACQELHSELLGIAPYLFRAPGGTYEKYIEYKVGWPIILWCDSGGDTGNNNATTLARRIVKISHDGCIMLMHDLHMKTAKGADSYLGGLIERGFLFATVEELMYLHEVKPEPDKVYVDTFGEYVEEGK